MNDIVVKCKGTMVHPNAIKHIVERGYPLREESKEMAVRFYLLAHALPTLPAQVLLDVIEGKLEYQVNLEEETFTIYNAVMP